MKNTIRQIAAFLFALLVIGSTTATAMSFHLCGGDLTDAALYSEAESCGMNHHSPKSDNPLVSKTACCVDDIVNFNSGISIVVEKAQSIDLTVFDNHNTSIKETTTVIVDLQRSMSLKNHSPPKEETGLFKRYQVYRI